jgi:phosphoserine phosphatase
MPDDPLASWIDGAVKTSIRAFVAAVTEEESADYVPPSDRIAVFDNDGTLWCERPLQVQFYFADDRLKARVAENPQLKDQLPYKAFLEHDLPAIKALGKKGLLEVAAFAHAGLTEDEFGRAARDWLATARHPKLGKLFPQLTYQPQVELLNYLRTHGFTNYIVSGGGADFMRAFSEASYGVPCAQVIGSTVKTRFEIKDGRGELMKLAEINNFNDREAKVSNIGLHIGRRPILAFGNSDGDLAMLRYAKTGTGRRLALLLHHDDAEREFAYDRDFQISPLAEALDNAGSFGFEVVSMKQHWRRVFTG